MALAAINVEKKRAKRKYGTVAQEIQFSEFYRTAINNYCVILPKMGLRFVVCQMPDGRSCCPFIRHL